MKTKSQMEMMGLVVIVILVSLIILFVIQFIVLKEPSSERREYTQGKLAANTLNALLKTTTDCKDQDITSLLQDCLNRPTSGSIVCIEGDDEAEPPILDMKSCEFVYLKIDEILKNSLKEWGEAYLLTILNVEENEIISFPNKDCSGERKSEFYYIPVDAGTAAVRLDICS